MPELALPDITLHYEVAGAGPPLMLIPGMLSDNASWLPILEPLAERHSLILPDPRGAGRTKPPDAPITLEGLAADMLALAEHLGHARFAILGHSLGGLVALNMATRAPDRVTHLATLASAPRLSARAVAVFETLCDIRETAGDRLYTQALFPWLFNERFFQDPSAVEAAVEASLNYPFAQPATAMRHQTEALAGLDFTGVPNHLPMPALALLAGEDALLSNGLASEAWQLLGARVETLPGAGHALHWDAPDDVAGRLLAFFAQDA